MTIPRPEYPRMQFVRAEWLNLNGEWSFEFDFGDSGLERGLGSSRGFERKILVPFCPESKLSGVGYTDFIPAMFYHRKITVPANWAGQLVMLHFGAVDFYCEGFLDGVSVGTHTGGSSSFAFDLTAAAKPGCEQDFVLHVRDDVRSGEQPGGKQSIKHGSYGCLYTRTTGIWQTVWLEPVPQSGLKRCAIVPDFDGGALVFTPEFYAEARDSRLSIRVFADGAAAGAVTGAVANGISQRIELSEKRAWSPEDPFLYQIVYEVVDREGRVSDRVEAYAGLRKVHIEGNRVFLNNRELFQRQVLDQGFYPDGIWTAPADADLKRDIELALAAGFNGARLHQKVFEERFHYWADRLGYLTWGEMPSWLLACFNADSKSRPATAGYAGYFNFLAEWRSVLERDRNHPSIISWTPVNETGGITDWALYRRRMVEIYELTKLIDPTRPVNDTSGYLHVKTDLWTVHLYMPDAAELKKRLHPDGKAVSIYENETGYTGQPYLLDEFGGFKYISPGRRPFAANTWGYNGIEIVDDDDLCRRIAEQVEVILADQSLAGYCYTQLTDVEQEQNGIYNYDRTPKLETGKIAAIFGKSRDAQKE